MRSGQWDNIFIYSIIGLYDFTSPFHSVKMHPFPLHPFRWEDYWSERRDLRKERGRINNKSIPCIAKKLLRSIRGDKHKLQGLRWSKRHIDHDRICELTWVMSI